MARKYFGQWLLEKSLISTDVLLAAVAMQKDSNKPLGWLAVESGYLTNAQVQAITHEQKRTDSFFGEIAVDKKLLLQDQLENLLAMQKKRRVLVGEALVRLRGISEDKMHKELLLFLENQKEGAVRLQHKLDNLEQAAVVKTFLDTTVTMLQRIVRGTVKISDVQTAPRHDNNLRYSISQRVEGGTKLTFSLALPDRLILLIASSMLAINQTEFHELTLDTTADYVSTIAGNAVEKLGYAPRKALAKKPLLTDMERLGAPIPCHLSLEMSSAKGDFQANFLFI